MEHTEEKFADLAAEEKVQAEASTDDNFGIDDPGPEFSVEEPVLESANVASAAVQEELENLRKRNEQLMRIAADFENYKRRHTREREDQAKFAGQSLITGLLPVIDNFERALQTEAKPEEFENFVEGVRMIHKQFMDLLHKSGVSVIEAVGQPFDPNLHEAIMSEENDEVPDETVTAEFQKGYVMHERLLRPSVVKVSKTS